MTRNKKVRLGVNLDHVATVRRARGTSYPDLSEAIRVAEDAGADGITLHLREDRRHIRDADIRTASAVIRTHLNMEMAAAEEIVRVALEVGPDFCCLVPEKREELTTEGGLDLKRGADELRSVCARLAAAGSVVSLFVEPDKETLERARDIGAPVVELHTGVYADAEGDAAARALERLRQGAEHAHAIGLTVNAGHGLRRDNVRAVAELPHMNELNIGHSIVADALFMGLGGAVREMRKAMGDS